MIQLLRQAHSEVDWRRVVERATRVKRPSMTTFLLRDQSLLLDMAGKLAEYFGIECRRTQRKAR